MIDPLGPLRWDLRSNGRRRIRHHIDDLAAQTPLVKLERRLALAVERQVRVDLHMVLVRRDEDVLCAPPNGSRLSCWRAEERFIPLSTRAVSFKRWLGSSSPLTHSAERSTGHITPASARPRERRKRTKRISRKRPTQLVKSDTP